MLTQEEVRESIERLTSLLEAQQEYADQQLESGDYKQLLDTVIDLIETENELSIYEQFVE
jgi:hypothetical protein